MHVAFVYWMRQIARNMNEWKNGINTAHVHIVNIKWVNIKVKSCATTRNVNCIRLNMFVLRVLLCVDWCIFVTRKLLFKSMKLEIYTAIMFSMFVKVNRYFFALPLIYFSDEY